MKNHCGACKGWAIRALLTLVFGVDSSTQSMKEGSSVIGYLRDMLLVRDQDSRMLGKPRIEFAREVDHLNCRSVRWERIPSDDREGERFLSIRVEAREGTGMRVRAYPE